MSNHPAARIILIVLSSCAVAFNSGCVTAALADPAANSPVALAKAPPLSRKLLGFAAGIVVGVPVCIVRRPWVNEKMGIEQMTGGNKSRRVVIPAAIVCAPFATAVGAFESPFVAFTDSLANFDQPFSKAQFSLTETEAPADLKGTPER